MKHLIAVKLIWFLLLMSCFSDNLVEEQIRNKIVDAKENTCKLSELVNFKWDKLYVCGPYLKANSLDATVSPYKEKIIASGVESDDRLCFLLFFYNNKLVESGSVKRNIDFDGLSKYDKKGQLLYLKPNQQVGWNKTGKSFYQIVLKN